MQQQYQCPNCKAPVAFGMRFCGNCGMQLNWPTQQHILPPSEGFATGQTTNLSTVKFHEDPILHSRAADMRGAESNVLYLSVLPKGIKLVQGGPTLRPKILKIKYLCKALMESPRAITYLYPAMADPPDSSIHTVHGYITIYDNYALQPTQPLNFITDEEAFFHALAEMYVGASTPFESDYKTLRGIINRKRWDKIPVFTPSSDLINGIPTYGKSAVKSLAVDWTTPGISC